MKVKASLELSTENLGSACLELRNEAEILRVNQVSLQAGKSKCEQEMADLKDTNREKEEAAKELQTKLNRVSAENHISSERVGSS